ncbi:MAG: saccharopine dehydrogenase NADP-binding domain-containing protein, partial [Flavisolibacter sp.]
MMKKILLFGAGKSATVLIQYLLDNAAKEQWQLTIADADLALIQQKTGGSQYARTVGMDIARDASRAGLIQEADLVISPMPANLHFLIAKDCLQYKKNLLTASYVDEQMRSLKDKIEETGLLFLCEMGLDPGIEHLSAKKLI